MFFRFFYNNAIFCYLLFSDIAEFISLLYLLWKIMQLSTEVMLRSD
jgi:hypothetical protein